jgi:hypothetical protein
VSYRKPMTYFFCAVFYSQKSFACFLLANRLGTIDN